VCEIINICPLCEIIINLRVSLDAIEDKKISSKLCCQSPFFKKKNYYYYIYIYPHKGRRRKIRTSDLRFIRRSLQPIKLLMGDVVKAFYLDTKVDIN
jgi:hypothetical protein